MAAAFRASSHTRSLVAVVVFLSASLLLLPFFSSRPLSRLASTPPFATSSSGQSSAVQADSSQPLLDSSQQLIGSLVPQLVPVDVAVPQERLAARVEELLAAWDPTRGVSPSRETGGKGRRASGRRKKRSKTAEGGAAANAAEADAASPLDASAEGPGELAQPLPPGPPVPRAPHLVDCALSTRRHRKEWWAARPPDGSLPPWAAAWETRAHASKDPRAYEMLPRRGGGGGGIGEDGERDGEGGKEDEGEQGRELREERDGGGSGSNAVAAAAGAAGAAGPAGLGIADSNAHTDINALTDVSQSFPLTTDADVIMEGPQPPWVEGGERDNAPLTRHVQAHLWRHQFPANCSHPHVRSGWISEAACVHGRSWWISEAACLHGRSGWISEEACVHGRSTWISEAACLHGRSAWISEEACEHGRSTWISEAACVHGRSAWISEAACMHGRSGWISEAACVHGRSWWISETACLHGRSWWISEAACVHGRSAWISEAACVHGRSAWISEAACMHGRSGWISEAACVHGRRGWISEAACVHGRSAWISEAACMHGRSGWISEAACVHGRSWWISETACLHGRSWWISEAACVHGRSAWISEAACVHGRSAWISEAACMHGRSGWISEAACVHGRRGFMYAALERRRRDGFAKQLAFMAAALGHAVQHGRVLVVRVYDRAQHTGCAGECNAQWHCYFLPETSDECRRRVKQLSELPASYAGPDPLIVTGRRVTDAPLEEWGDGEGEGEGDGEEGDGDMSDAENPTNQSLEAGKPGRAGSAADYFHAEVPTAWGKPWREMGEAVGVGGGGAAVGGDGEEKVGGASKGMPAPSQLNRVKHLWWRAQALRFLLRAPSPYLCHISNVVRHMTFGPMAARLAALGELAVTQADVAAGEGHQVRQGEKEGDEMRQEHKEEAAQQQQQEEAQREEEDYQRQEGLRRRLKGQRGSGRTAGFISLAATSSATNSPGSNDVPNKSSSATGNLATANKPTSTTASHSPPTINATASPATMEGDVWARHVPVWVPRPLVSVHVARPSRASTPAYVRTAMALLLLLRQQQPSARFVWLTADEQEPLEQVAATPGWTWLYSHTPRASNSSATTPASPPPSSTRAKQQQLPLQVAVDAAFANLLVAVQADAFIGSTLSPWSCLVNALRCTGGKLQSTFLDVGL
ncbi:hypothetical protein CLOM_g22389 [Closterium sp. NIES-68]|nr:hypothetical protein CLOM_g22389 [Closterium sp. NIES-68]